MKRSSRLVFSLLAVVGILLVPAIVAADVCLMTYPTAPCEYHYSSADKYTVGPGDPFYDPAYDLGGEVLIKIDPIDGDGIALDVYQAPGLEGFVHDETDQGYFFFGHAYDLVIDGYSRTPTTFVNILLVFDTFENEACAPDITVDGLPVMHDPILGYYFPVGNLDVSTPTPVGNAYSDTRSFTINLQDCSGFRVWAFSDENSNLALEVSEECFTAYSHDSTVPNEDLSWGDVKSLYR